MMPFSITKNEIGKQENRMDYTIGQLYNNRMIEIYNGAERENRTPDTELFRLLLYH
jgi:hypothetical protein